VRKRKWAYFLTNYREKLSFSNNVAKTNVVEVDKLFGLRILRSVCFVFAFTLSACALHKKSIESVCNLDTTLQGEP
jgi:hypothetical protein